MYVFVVLLGNEIHVLDIAAKLDQCAEYMCTAEWGQIDFPPPFGREALPEVQRSSENGVWAIVSLMLVTSDCRAVASIAVILQIISVIRSSVLRKA